MIRSIVSRVGLIAFLLASATMENALCSTAVSLGWGATHDVYIANGYGGAFTSFDGDLTKLNGGSIFAGGNPFGPNLDYGTQGISNTGTLGTKAWLIGSDDATSWYSAKDYTGRFMAVDSYASYTDQLTFSGNVGLGSFRLVLDQHGDYQAGGQAESFGETYVTGGSKRVLDAYQRQSGTMEYTTDAIPFQYGTAVSLTVTSRSSALLWNPSGNILSGDALADASHTTIVRGIEVFDANGNLLGNVPVSSSSGFVYQPVPEPSSFAVLGLGSLAFVRCRRRKGGVR